MVNRHDEDNTSHSQVPNASWSHMVISAVRSSGASHFTYQSDGSFVATLLVGDSVVVLATERERHEDKVEHDAHRDEDDAQAAADSANDARARPVAVFAIE